MLPVGMRLRSCPRCALCRLDFLLVGAWRARSLDDYLTACLANRSQLEAAVNLWQHLVRSLRSGSPLVIRRRSQLCTGALADLCQRSRQELREVAWLDRLPQVGAGT